MKKTFSKKMLSGALVTAMLVTSTAGLSACGNSGSASKEPVTLTVYSQLANYQGAQIGWAADILLKKLNVKLNIVPESSGTFQTRMESGDLGDIVIFGSSENYKQAVNNNLLFDWEKGDLLKNFGPYIKDNLKDALNWNKELNSQLTDGKDSHIYGIGDNCATSSKDHNLFFYTWDTRWDLYKKLGYPKIKNMKDQAQMLKNMQKICPKDENGNRVYGVSLWPDWDKDMVMYVKATATAYYGYDELGIGLYDPSNGKYHDALEKNGPYLEMLKWYNGLYKAGLVDPDSMTQKFDNMTEKVSNGGVLFSIFNYSGQIPYNTTKHLKQGKMMYSMKPDDATPIVYGMNTAGGTNTWAIGSKSKYPDIAMKVLNYLATPDGYLEMTYGPKGETWDYNKEGDTYLTKHGRDVYTNKDKDMGNGHKGSFNDGSLKVNNVIWSIDAVNPKSKDHESYNKDNWKSEQDSTSSSIMNDWKKHMGVDNSNEYFENGNYLLMPGLNYTATTKSDELKTTWTQVTKSIREQSWNAMYAETDSEYNKIVNRMLSETKKYGYDECVKWGQGEAAIKKKLSDKITQ